MSIRKNEEETLKKLSFMFNFFMIFTELFFLVSFLLYRLNILIPMVIVNMLLSSFSFFLIKRKKYYSFILILYFICLGTMTICTLFLGFGYGFHLYSLSLTSVSFYIYYVGHKMNIHSHNPIILSGLSIALYFVCLFILKKSEPICTADEKLETIFFIYNSVTVFSILIIYMSMYIRTIINSENELERLANSDKLTGLFNRHYLLSYIDSLYEKPSEKYWIAILDIDNFKGVNDRYGHNCGDYVLRKTAEITSEICNKCTVCRWGGEEFIILGSEKVSHDILDEVRKKVAQTTYDYEGNTVSVTVTIGVQHYADNYSTDLWISAADNKLYYGKQNGKNRVVL